MALGCFSGQTICSVLARVALICLFGGLLTPSPSIRAERLPIKTYTIADGLAHDLIIASSWTRADISGSVPARDCLALTATLSRITAEGKDYPAAMSTISWRLGTVFIWSPRMSESTALTLWGVRRQATRR